ncbi:RNA chaperone Hfq [Noviherbaspirillum humi]|uniref:RNA chaperone Hfq n=1 Tax=Noviherbaspirillum humi TaxID=1688639 RepID=A0A239KK94_9BURK|nr:RNA chaperone Hfq [Noviherbaspirillum humi]
MSDNKRNSLQDPYLNDLRKRHMTVLIYLVNGVRQYGHIESFDQHTILLKNGTNRLIIYKHTVASLMPAPKAIPEAKAKPAAAPMANRAPAGASSGAPASTPVIIRKPATRRIITRPDNNDN